MTRLPAAAQITPHPQRSEFTASSYRVTTQDEASQRRRSCATALGVGTKGCRFVRSVGALASSDVRANLLGSPDR